MPFRLRPAAYHTGPNPSGMTERGPRLAAYLARRHVLVALAVTALVVAACDDQPPSAPPVASPLPSPTLAAPTPSDALPLPSVSFAPPASADVPPAPSGSPPAILEDSHFDPELEATLPSQVEGITLDVYSLGPDALITPQTEQSWTAFLVTAGGRRSGLSFAAATDRSGELAGAVSATRVAGAEAGALIRAGIEAQTPIGGEPPATSEVQLAGRTVTAVSSELAGAPATLYLFADGDILFAVSAADPAIAEAIVAALGD